MRHQNGLEKPSKGIREKREKQGITRHSHNVGRRIMSDSHEWVIEAEGPPIMIPASWERGSGGNNTTKFFRKRFAGNAAKERPSLTGRRLFSFGKSVHA
jgi:hypothetical protein